jgi:hypothetical protein
VYAVDINDGFLEENQEYRLYQVWFV